jgi:uncharacterized protein DUF6484
MRRKEAQVTHLNPAAFGREELSRGAVTGRVTAVDDQGIVTVWIKGCGPRHARLAVPATLARIQEAIDKQQAVLLFIDEHAPERPIIVGFVEDRVSSEEAPEPQVVEADVDGKRVRLVGKDEVVLECGSASITLRRNGRVVIKGAYVETHSDGTNRIKGGQVRIN